MLQVLGLGKFQPVETLVPGLKDPGADAGADCSACGHGVSPI